MRNLYLVLALVINGSVIIAQTNDPAAKKVLDAVSAKFKTFSSVQAGFTYKVRRKRESDVHKEWYCLDEGQ